MTLLSIVQNVADELGIKRPLSVATSTDQQIRQLYALVNREGKLLGNRHPWEALTNEITHTTLAAELQGAIATIAPGYKYIVNDIMWNRTLNRPVPGPLSNTEWQTLKSGNVTGPYQEYRIRLGNLYFLPAPSAGDTIAFEIVSSNWAETSLGVGISKMTADTDVGVISEDLIEMGVKWRWLKAKGFDYAEEYNDYEREVATQFGRDGTKAVAMLDRQRQRRPGILIPDGNWVV